MTVVAVAVPAPAARSVAGLTSIQSAQCPSDWPTMAPVDWGDRGTRAVEPRLHGCYLVAPEHSGHRVKALGSWQPAHVAERETKLVGVELLLVIRETVEDRQVQRVHFPVEDGLVEGFRAS